LKIKCQFLQYKICFCFAMSNYRVHWVQCSDGFIMWSMLTLYVDHNFQHQVDMSLYLDTLFWFQAHPSLFLLLNAACLAEKQQIPNSLFLVWTDINPMKCFRSTRSITLSKMALSKCCNNLNICIESSVLMEPSCGQ
jgi:hypothetical protein